MIKKILLSILGLMMVLQLTSCKKDDKIQEESLVVNSYSKEEYAVLIPYSITSARTWHGKYNSKLDNMVIPKGLKNLSKKHFAVSKNYLQEGLLLDEEMIKTLQRRESDEYPYSLNPPLGEFKVNDVISVENPYIVSDIIELDFISNEDSKTLNGISLCMIMNNTIKGNDGENIVISDDRLFTFGSTMGRKLERYMRTLTDVEATLPIYITLYVVNDESSYVPGHFLGEGLFEGRSGQFNEIYEEWVIFPSDEAQAKDGVLYSSVVSLKQSIQNFIPENMSFVAKGKFVDNQCVYLGIDIDAQAKTYTEIYALSQYVHQIVMGIDNPDLEVVIDIASMGDTIFTIKKELNSTKYVVQDMS